MKMMKKPKKKERDVGGKMQTYANENDPVNLSCFNGLSTPVTQEGGQKKGRNPETAGATNANTGIDDRCPEQRIKKQKKSRIFLRENKRG